LPPNDAVAVCAGIGVVAMATMLERLEHPELPVRDVTVPTKLVVRRSCGAHLGDKVRPEPALTY
jgi:hypothetical protein